MSKVCNERKLVFSLIGSEMEQLEKSIKKELRKMFVLDLQVWTSIIACIYESKKPQKKMYHIKLQKAFNEYTEK